MVRATPFGSAFKFAVLIAHVFAKQTVLFLDHGKNWRPGAEAANGSECMAAVNSDGSVLLNMRDSSPGPEVDIGLYPIVTLQYSPSTVYQASYHSQLPFF